MADLTHRNECRRSWMAGVSGRPAAWRAVLAAGVLFCLFGQAATADEQGTPSDFVYMASATSPFISRFQVGSDGTLLPLSPASVETGLGAIQSGIAVSFTGRFVYVTNRNRNTVSQFRADTDGLLTPLAPPDVPTGEEPESITFHPAGKYVYVAGHDSIFQYQVSVTGHLRPLVPASVPCPIRLKRLVLDTAGRFAYAVGIDGVMQYKVAAAGTLSALSPGGANTGQFPTDMVISPRGFAYVACYSGLFQYKIGADGTLAPLTPAIVPAGEYCQALALDPRGQRLYAVNHVNNGNGSVAQYTLGADGGLTHTADALLAAGQGPKNMAIDPSGRFLFVTSSDYTVSRFAIAADGSLTALTPMLHVPIGSVAIARHSLRFVPARLESQPPTPTTSPTLSPEFQTALTQHPEFVYVANTPSDTISQFRVQANGTLAALGTCRTGSQPRSLALEPKGRFAYVACAGNGHLWQYGILPDGSLAPLKPPTVYSGDLPFSVTVTPDSKFVYAANRLGNTISQFRIGADGTLTALADPVKTASVPTVVTVDPTGRFVYARCEGFDVISCFAIGPDGTLAEARASVGFQGGGIPSVPIFSAGGFAYINADQAIWQYRAGPSGTLMPLSPTHIRAEKPPAQPAGLATESAGKFLYSSNQDDNSLSSYLIGRDGTLSPLSLTPIPTGANSGPLVADPSGHFLYVLNESNRAITQYQITDTGALALLTPAQVEAGKLEFLADPNAIAIVRR